MTVSERATCVLRTRLDCLGISARVRGWALAQDWPDVAAGELALLTAELTTNAVLHGGGGRCSVELGPDHCELVVEDEGPGFTLPVLEDAGRSWSLTAAGPREPGEPAQTVGLGSGLASARRFSDLLELENRPTGGARVRATRSQKTASKFHLERDPHGRQ